MRRFSRIAAVAAVGLALAASLAWFDRALWNALDAGAPPIRSFVSDQHYYLMRAHRVVLEGRAIESPYFFEHAGGKKRYLLFEAALGLAGRLLAPRIGANPVTWGGLLRFAAALATYASFFCAYRRWMRCGSFAASVAAALTVLWFMPRILYMGNSLTAWFLAPAIFGLCLLREALERPAGHGRLVRLAAATLCFAFHPISYAVGLLTIAAALALRCAEERDRESAATVAIWLAFALAIGALLYGAFVGPPGSAAAETLPRNLSIASRLPALPVTSLRTLSALALCAILLRRSASRDRSAWQVVVAAYAAGFVGLNLNVVTGAYFLNDHYGFILPVLPPLAAGLALGTGTGRLSRFESVISIFAVVILAHWSLAMLSDGGAWGQAKAFIHLGTILALFAVAATAFGLKTGNLSRLPRSALAAIIALAIVLPIVSTLAWLDGYSHEQWRAHDERSVIEALERLEPGVVLSNPARAETVALYTPHRPYWSALAFGDEASDAELRARWRTALRVFPSHHLLLAPATGRRSLYGHQDLMCIDQWPLVAEEHGPYRFLERHGFRNDLCRPAPDEEVWSRMIEEARAAPGAPFSPEYRLDYLLLDAAAGDRLPEDLKTSFELIRRRPLLVYRYLGNSVRE